MKKLEGNSDGRIFASPARILQSQVTDAWVKGKFFLMERTIWR
jgi:hypothetical protein